ncbi:MAG: tRNA pseudouridine synthase A [Holophaga sp.]|nr:tRNA pseudouridine synthase A [Holophaga sp.]
MKPRPAPRIAYRLAVEYDGSRFHGWQKQGERQVAQGIRTVTGTLERVLEQAGHKVLTLGGSGRTDAGVHALGQVAHLHMLSSAPPRPQDLQRVFDEGLPSDVAVTGIQPCGPTFHARHDAISRSYLYQLSLRRSAFGKSLLWWVKGRMDLHRLEDAWSLFAGNHDAASFADLEPGEDSRVQIKTCELLKDGSLVLLRTTAGFFLRRQVRRMVGAVVLCGLGKERLETLRRDLENPNKEANLHWAEKAAPAAGLFLERVRYPGDPETTPLRSVLWMP